jgi:plasmid stabilization system protein ParE
MKEFALRLSSEAERCIEEQLLWHEADDANGGIELADRWMEMLEAALERLRKHPERHGFAPENGRWRADISIRQMRFKPWKTPSSWRILYVMDEKASQVTVLQIRHERRPLLGDDRN